MGFHKVTEKQLSPLYQMAKKKKIDCYAARMRDISVRDIEHAHSVAVKTSNNGR